MAACPACGFEYQGDFKFCPDCAAPLPAVAAARETRKIVTALFCDLVGSTSLGEQHDPEVLRPMLHWVSGLGFRAGHWAHGEPAPHGDPAV
jgi:hypothetical protein